MNLRRLKSSGIVNILDLLFGGLFLGLLIALVSVQLNGWISYVVAFVGWGIVWVGLGEKRDDWRLILSLCAAGGFYFLAAHSALIGLANLVTGGFSGSDKSHPVYSHVTGYLVFCVGWLLLGAPHRAFKRGLDRSGEGEAQRIFLRLLTAVASVLTAAAILMLHFDGGPLRHTGNSQLAVGIILTVLLLLPAYRSSARACWQHGIYILSPKPLIKHWNGAVKELNTAFSRSKYEIALADYTRKIEQNPEDLMTIGLRGEMYGKMGRYSEALADFNRAVELDPSDMRGIASRGKTYRFMGRYEEALADFNRAIELDPSLDQAISDRGETYRLMGRYEEALADFNRAIELDPSLDQAISDRGETYRLMGRYEEALADFNRAIELDPDSAWDIGSRGQTYHAMGRYEEALADFNRAIELDPSLDWAISGRGETCRAMDRYEEASPT